MSAVAIYGGSFNPPHVAHELVSLLVLETTAVDELWWVPTYRHAFGKILAPWDDRVAMCKLAVERLGLDVRVCEIEAELPDGGGRMLTTLQALEKRHPGTRFRLVVGADVLAEAHLWYRWDDVVSTAPPIVVARRGFPGVDGALPEVPSISSTEVRARVAAGGTAVPLVSRRVMDYIAAGALYR